MSLYWYKNRAATYIKDVDQYPGLATWLEIRKAIPRMFCDRTGNTRTPFLIELDSRARIPDLSQSSAKTFRECAYERASEILSRAEASKKPIYLLFSGGIDSTTVATAFLAEFPLSRLKDCIKVVTTPGAWVENPRFLHEHLLPHFEFLSARDIGHFFDGRAHVVTGELNEYYTFAMVRVDSSKKYSKDEMHAFLVQAGMTTHAADIWTDVIDANQRIAPMPLVTMEDVLWWLRFNWTWQRFKFQTLLIMHPAHAIPNISAFNERVHHFFDSEHFQLWGMTNTDRSSRKHACREYIHAYTGDTEWTTHKGKMHSFRGVVFDQTQICGIRDDFSVFSDHQLLLEHFDPQNSFIG